MTIVQRKITFIEGKKNIQCIEFKYGPINRKLLFLGETFSFFTRL